MTHNGSKLIIGP